MDEGMDLNRLAEAGDLDALRRVFAGAPPSSDADRLRWCCLFLEVGARDDAAALAAAVECPSEASRAWALLGTEEPSSRGLSAVPQRSGERSEEAPEPEGDAGWEPDLPPRDVSAERDQETIELFLRWFGGRRDLYARQWYAESRRRGGYRPVREPLTDDVVRSHLSGRQTIGQYLLDARGKVHFAVLDLDVTPDALEQLPDDDGPADPLRHGPLTNFLKRLVEAARRLGLPLHPAASGSRGAHGWLFFESPKSAAAARSILQQVASVAGPPPPSVSLEIFPKQDLPGPKGLSSLVKLPDRKSTRLNSSHYS